MRSIKTPGRGRTRGSAGIRGGGVALLCAALLLNGCGSSPSKKVDTQADSAGFERLVIAGAPFKHLAYFRPVTRKAATLHVYIEHDGTPWASRSRVAADPTPNNPLMLELMALDTEPSLYLGRPCYFGVDNSPPCSPIMWTHRRFSEEVITSMVTALKNFLAARKYQGIAFFGHSGGGTLAVLLAERFRETRAVVSLAGNLDLEQWAQHNGFSPLEGSLDPMQRPSLPVSVLQWHYAGGQDRQVPPSVVKSYAFGRPGPEVSVIADFDHDCCWARLWPNLLADLNRRLAQ